MTGSGDCDCDENTVSHNALKPASPTLEASFHTGAQVLQPAAKACHIWPNPPSSAVFEHVRAEFSRLNPNVKSTCTRQRIRQYFNLMLHRRGLIYISSQGKFILDLLSLFTVVKEHLATRFAAVKDTSGILNMSPETWSYWYSVRVFKEQKMKLA